MLTFVDHDQRLSLLPLLRTAFNVCTDMAISTLDGHGVHEMYVSLHIMNLLCQSPVDEDAQVTV